MFRQLVEALVVLIPQKIQKIQQIRNIFSFIFVSKVFHLYLQLFLYIVSKSFWGKPCLPTFSSDRTCFTFNWISASCLEPPKPFFSSQNSFQLKIQFGSVLMNFVIGNFKLFLEKRLYLEYIQKKIMIYFRYKKNQFLLSLFFPYLSIKWSLNSSSFHASLRGSLNSSKLRSNPAILIEIFSTTFEIRSNKKLLLLFKSSWLSKRRLGQVIKFWTFRTSIR